MAVSTLTPAGRKFRGLPAGRTGEWTDVKLTPYRRVLAAPGMTRLLIITTIARIPGLAASIVLTLYVVGNLHRGYADAGLLATAMTIGVALGGPWRGRAIDRYGVRAALLPSIVGSAVFWGFAPFLSYPLLVPAALLAGLLNPPVFGISRQAIGVMLPEELRRTGFALDSVLVEISYMIGPLIGVLVSTTVSPVVTILGLGAFQVAACVALIVLNPRVSAVSRDSVGEPAVKRTRLISSGLVAVLVLMAASTLALAGSEVAAIAVLRDQHQDAVVGVVLAVWAVGSMIGGFLYGGVSRALSSATLVIALGVGTVLLTAAPNWWVLAIALLPVGMLCAPSISATVADVNKLVPAVRRGEAMGWHGTAGTAGVSIGAPLAGFAIDYLGPIWGFAVTGGVGLALALFAIGLARFGSGRGRPATRRLFRRTAADPTVTPAAAS
ncbi:MFS transporter [Fodinicola acaciae]|uniref:MFS transporter n=1 Tax=Fodinicola acaciae TaxID=2681555 RepID=UPI0013D2ADA1|nr:MFS transporter [Fodinicola acaciae]